MLRNSLDRTVQQMGAEQSSEIKEALEGAETEGSNEQVRIGLCCANGVPF